MISKETVTAIANEWLANTDYFLVDVQVSADNLIVVDIDHAEGVWIDDCAELSRFIESRLNREDEDYELEVGSAGVGQPFKVRQQWVNHVGKDIEVLKNDGVKLRGVLKEAGDDSFTVSIQVKRKEEGKKRPVLANEDVTLAYGDVKYGKYIF